MSSAEAGYYSMVKVASEGFGLKAMTMDYRKPLSPWMFVDATAAIGVAQRFGLRKLRHVSTQSPSSCRRQCGTTESVYPRCTGR